MIRPGHVLRNFKLMQWPSTQTDGSTAATTSATPHIHGDKAADAGAHGKTPSQQTNRFANRETEKFSVLSVELSNRTFIGFDVTCVFMDGMETCTPPPGGERNWLMATRLLEALRYWRDHHGVAPHPHLPVIGGHTATTNVAVERLE